MMNNDDTLGWGARDAAFEEANEQEIRHIRQAQLEQDMQQTYNRRMGLTNGPLQPAPDTGGEWRIVNKNGAVIRIVEAENTTIAVSCGNTKAERRQHAATMVRDHHAVRVLMEALGYISERLDSDLSTFKDADDSEVVKVDVTVGWLREVHAALATAARLDRGEGQQ